MTQKPDSHTLFHLVPTNQLAHDALLHPDNQKFVSRNAHGNLGLEIGFHVSSMQHGHVITRLGRDADLILSPRQPQEPMSRVHVAFEVNPTINMVVLSVRSKKTSTVKFRVHPPEENGANATHDSPEGRDMGLVPNKVSEQAEAQEIIGDGVLLYVHEYDISIASYSFHLCWWQSPRACETLVREDYDTARLLLQECQSRGRATEFDEAEARSWYLTRQQTAAKTHRFKDIPHLRKSKGSGAFGEVFEAVDWVSGNKFAIKVVKLKKGNHGDEARATLYREIEILKRLKHPHIIECLGVDHFDSLRPEIFMPLQEGSLTDLIIAKKAPDHAALCKEVLKQCLSALAFLSSEKVIHRDVKPDNILYNPLPEDQGFLFQLADFGLAQSQMAARTVCGTPCYQAPELWPSDSKIKAGQSPKMDVFSLLATILAIDCEFREFPPPHCQFYGDVLREIERRVSLSEYASLAPMARRDPRERASAAQMLQMLFDGWGLPSGPLKTGDVGIAAPRQGRVKADSRLIVIPPPIPTLPRNTAPRRTLKRGTTAPPSKPVQPNRTQIPPRNPASLLNLAPRRNARRSTTSPTKPVQPIRNRIPPIRNRIPPFRNRVPPPNPAPPPNVPSSNPVPRSHPAIRPIPRRRSAAEPEPVQPIRKHQGGIAKRRAASSKLRADTLAGLLLEPIKPHAGSDSISARIRMMPGAYVDSD